MKYQNDIKHRPLILTFLFIITNSILIFINPGLMISTTIIWIIWRKRIREAYNFIWRKNNKIADAIISFPDDFAPCDTNSLVSYLSNHLSNHVSKNKNIINLINPDYIGHFYWRYSTNFSDNILCLNDKKTYLFYKNKLILEGYGLRWVKKNYNFIFYYKKSFNSDYFTVMCGEKGNYHEILKGIEILDIMEYDDSFLYKDFNGVNHPIIID